MMLRSLTILLIGVFSASAAPIAPMRMKLNPTNARLRSRQLTGEGLSFTEGPSLKKADAKPTVEYFTHDLNGEQQALCMRMRGGSSGTAIENNINISFKHETAFDSAGGAVSTKFICTIGPNTQSSEMLGKLVSAGMNVARMNFSHGDHEYHAQTIANLREYLAQSKRMCAILLDTKGPEIRTSKNKDGKDLTLTSGQEIKLVNNFEMLSDNTQIGHSYPNLSKFVEVGGTILIDDGLIELTILSKTDDTVTCKVKNSGSLGQTKGVNLPGAKVDLPALTERDKGDLAFGAKQGVDFIAASFIRKAEDVTNIRAYLDSVGGSKIKIISKIENQEGLQNFDEILRESDAIMVARGDLGVEIPMEKVAIAQKMMISKCNIAGKQVITATQMLESMIQNPRPTRAETTDVANAVFDGTDCVMLSGETAKGKYPINAIETMVAICREAEQVVDYTQTFAALRAYAKRLGSEDINEAIASSAVKTAFDLKASLVLCLTNTGRTARLICKYKPTCPVLCATADSQAARQCLILRGCYPMIVTSMVGSASLIGRCIATAKVNGLCKVGDVCVVISGMKEGVSGGTNVLRVIKVD
uniref:Pyruvate kinase n=1 Tax=Hemiselmis andersenii TaxID=464988 RepID=A0A6U2G9T1_HEMAN|mmetsp:Transcript_35582/g.83334  ORF Transcript_35582/g.83334 Transcript_35582/m.83334 type:complete len:587 (+) Transcript_35582:67-1827(+)|eukprot:CAMPEP_0114128306 /NCGR_PEP_ID=MMETSP0043_2-20121206/10859_1 /TAXON_ID=464988 /ORGANISM="Hemiselmis andersenii, Strain CCMP644" /LENGTH=586 /DNA_ID=CAMNT_0001221481 /DNA_START=94 /DNA_END=1854 /DNA_ORIENTATION=+